MLTTKRNRVASSTEKDGAQPWRATNAAASSVTMAVTRLGLYRERTTLLMSAVARDPRNTEDPRRPACTGVRPKSSVI